MFPGAHSCVRGYECVRWNVRYREYAGALRCASRLRDVPPHLEEGPFTFAILRCSSVGLLLISFEHSFWIAGIIFRRRIYRYR